MFHWHWIAWIAAVGCIALALLGCVAAGSASGRDEGVERLTSWLFAIGAALIVLTQVT